MSEHQNPVETGVSSKLAHCVEKASKMWWLKPIALFFLLVFVFTLGASFGGHNRGYEGRNRNGEFRMMGNNNDCIQMGRFQGRNNNYQRLNQGSVEQYSNPTQSSDSVDLLNY